VKDRPTDSIIIKWNDQIQCLREICGFGYCEFMSFDNLCEVLHPSIALVKYLGSGSHLCADILFISKLVYSLVLHI